MADPKLTNEIIDAAILGFEEQKRRIDAQIAELQGMRSGSNHTSVSSTEPRQKMIGVGIPLAVLYLLNGTVRVETQVDDGERAVSALRAAR